ncbi:hypothetical protein HYR99_02650 [Candidatus Poribacteria bacterium]|nr:hypothetical protein [Candidatus Poribacteria bacterium]
MEDIFPTDRVLDVQITVDEKDWDTIRQTERARMKDRKKYENRQSVKVLDPAGFNKSQKNPLFSGPQPGEKLPSFKATGLRGDLDGKEFDPVALAAGKPQILIFQDDNPNEGDRSIYTLFSSLRRIASKSKQELHMSLVFLGDDPDTPGLKKLYQMAKQFVPEAGLVGVSREGREGPGAYGLNRNVAMTILVAKGGKVTHNFAFAQPMVWPDPHLLGAIADVIGEEPATLEKWLNEEQGEGERMREAKPQ